MVGSVAGLCRNNEGTLLDGFTKQIWAPSVFVAESLAAREGLLWLKEKRSPQLPRTELEMEEKGAFDQHVHLTLDNLSLINSLLGQETSPWVAHSIFNDCKELLTHIGGFRWILNQEKQIKL